MKKILSLFFLFLCFRIVSQPNTPKFISIGTANSNERSAAIYVKPDGSYFIGGSKNDSALVMYLSNADSIIWAKTFKFQPAPCYANYLSMTSDGYVIGTGMTIVGNVYRCCYFKINPANGNFIWNNNFNGNNLYLSRIIEKNVNEYICMGVEYPIFPNGVYADNKNVIVSASTGAIISQPNLIGFQLNNGIDDMEAGTDINPTDGTFYSSGRSYVQVGTNKMRATLIKYNSNGNPIWFKYLHKDASASCRMYPRDLIFVNSTQLLLMYHSDENCSGGCVDYYSGMMLLDTSGNVIWDKIYNISASNGENAEKVNVIGNRIYLRGYLNTNSPNSADVFILKTDMNGNPLVCNKYGSPTLKELPFVNNLGNGGDTKSNLLYFTYSAENPSTGLSDINVLKLDTTLQLSCYSPTPLAVSAITFAPFSTSFPPQFMSAPFATAANSTYNTNFPNPCPANYTRSVTVVSILANDTILNVYNSNATSYYWYSNGSTTPTMQITAPATADSVMIYSGCLPHYEACVSL
ncbi:MAG: hypothetical protein KF900_09635 [Bacteroidetes bacterium]|nr:hypothetical protein [Bacteroidota bacterium]